MKLQYFFLVFNIVLFISCKNTTQNTKKHNKQTTINTPTNKNVVAQKENKNQVLKQLQTLLVTIKNETNRYSIEKDTLIVIKKATTKQKQTTVFKLPLQKLVDVKLNKNTITLLTKFKDIEEQRYQYKKLMTSQVVLTTNSNKTTNELYKLFTMLKK